MDSKSQNEAVAVAETSAPVAKAEPKLHLSPLAAKKIREQIEKRANSVAASGIRVGVKGGGCSGLSYVIEFCDAPRPKDKLIELDGAKVYVDPKSLIYLNGTTLDYVDTFQQKGFKFNNPQQKSECGCGESFSVQLAPSLERALGAAFSRIRSLHVTNPIACWSCGAPRGADAPLCPACGKVQPAAPHRAGETRVADKFAMLELPRSFDLDEAVLGEKFRALSRKLHPDRFVRATAPERRFALEQTTRLNDAHRTLREPARRAEHLLELRGIHLAGEGRETKLPVAQPISMSMEFLEEMMEEREALLEVKHGENAAEKMAALAKKMEEKRAATMSHVAAMLRALDTPEAKPIGEVAEQIARLRYQDRYLDEALGRGGEH